MTDPEMVINEHESYPTGISQPPVSVAGCRVLAWAETRRRNGNYPGGFVLCRESHESPRWVTWEAYTKDGGTTWHATSGHYIHDHDHAWADFVERCTDRVTEGWKENT